MTRERADYSALDRLLHILAFTTGIPQMTAADVERGLFGRRFREIQVVRPVFVTSLPRAGTTLLLEILSRAPELGSHRYRDMPFVLAPILWDTFSSHFHRESGLKERAHGDGVKIGYDSPEAFEEVLWRAFWPERFKGSAIPLWSEGDHKDGFPDFFRDHIRRIIAVRSAADDRVSRYVSKNNANIARLKFLKKLFPDCVIVVPFREPMDQARSLLRQHERFTEIHRQDPFAKRYMRDIGHFEFGALHRPLDFPRSERVGSQADPESLEYWLEYWVGAFQEILTNEDSVSLLSYDRLCEQGVSSLRVLESHCHLTDKSLTGTAGDLLRAPTRYPPLEQDFPKDLLSRVESIYAALLDRSII